MQPVFASNSVVRKTLRQKAREQRLVEAVHVEEEARQRDRLLLVVEGQAVRVEEQRNEREGRAIGAGQTVLLAAEVAEQVTVEPDGGDHIGHRRRQSPGLRPRVKVIGQASRQAQPGQQRLIDKRVLEARVMRAG